MDPEPLQVDRPVESRERRVVYDRRDLEVEVRHVDEPSLPTCTGEPGQVQVRESVLLKGLTGKP